MKRILQIVGSMDRGGAETMVMNLYRVIDRSKYQFDFVYFTSKQVCDYDKEITELGGRIFRLPIKNPLKRVGALRDLLRSHPEWKTVHCHTLFANAFNLYAAFKEGVPQRIAHSHSTANQSEHKWVGGLYQKWARAAMAKYATHFVACGEAAGRYLFPNQDNVLMFPNAVNSEYFARMARTQKDFLRRQYGLGQQTIIVLQIGRLSKVKNHEFSIAIAAKMKARGLDFRMFFAGQGDLESDLKALTHEQGLNDNIIFLGIRSDVPELMAGADVLLMPSFHEGFPVTLVEAQASGLPCVIADTISPEVDLGGGLVRFLSLTKNMEEWIESILNFNRHHVAEVHQEKSRENLIQKGFDIRDSVLKIQELYMC